MAGARADDLPRRTRDYRGTFLESRRWDAITPRDDDIVITTAYKAGTTWMQTIVAEMIFRGQEIPGPVMEISPWVDNGVRPLADMLALVEAQEHRRFLKSHLALDGLRFFAQAKYIYVGRDPRDIFMSLWNHHRNYSTENNEMLQKRVADLGLSWPACPEDIRDFWRDWITRGSFPWEGDGFPYWSCLHHLQSWWDWRHLPNVLFVHYGDLTKDPRAEMERVAAFLDIDLPDAAWPGLVEATGLRSMRARSDRIMGKFVKSWQGGGNTFLHQGGLRKWTGHLLPEDLKLYEAARARVLSAEAAAWAEGGRKAQPPTAP